MTKSIWKDCVKNPPSFSCDVLVKNIIGDIFPVQYDFDSDSFFTLGEQLTEGSQSIYVDGSQYCDFIDYINAMCYWHEKKESKELCFV